MPTQPALRHKGAGPEAKELCDAWPRKYVGSGGETRRTRKGETSP